ncbi:MAG: hypothetical protein QM493_10710 [Sulfurovum sp.]
MKYLSLASACILLSSTAYAMERTQVIQLEKGWNAVYLEVDPTVDKQNLSAFMMPLDDANKSISTPISMIATYYTKSSSVEYISDPAKIGWKKATWNRWIRDDLPEAFLSNLYDLEANQGYLVKADKDFVWEVKGEVRDYPRRWQPNSFNLVGFNVSSSAQSFYQYFQNNKATKAFENSIIYTLKEGKWLKVNPIDEEVKANTAYWIYAKGSSKFQGVLDLNIEGGSSELSFLDIVNTKTIELKNTSSSAITVTVTLEDNQVPLSLVGRDKLFNTTYTPVNTLVSTFILVGNSYEKFQLAVRRNEITGNDKKEGLLKFTVSPSAEVFYLAISAYGGN